MTAGNVNNMERKQGAAKVMRDPEITDNGQYCATTSNLQSYICITSFFSLPFSICLKLFGAFK